MDKQLQKVAHQWMRDKKLVVEMKHIMPDAERQLISYMKQSVRRGIEYER